MMAQSQMQRDVLELNMEDQLNQIAGQKYGKTMADAFLWSPLFADDFK